MRTLLINRHRETALQVLDEMPPVQVIRMQAGKLEFSKLTAEEIAEDGWFPSNYPIDAAISKFLAHETGHSSEVHRALVQALFF